jgi:hypothetical protein
LLLARVLAVVDARGGAAVRGAGIGAPVVFDVASAPLAPPWPEQVPRPVEFEVVPSAQIVVTCAPAVFFVTAFAAFVSLFTTFFSFATAFLSTPPWPEQAPRPDETEVVPSLQIVAAACALSVPADTASAVAVTVANSQFRDESMLPPRLQREEGEKMSG